MRRLIDAEKLEEILRSRCAQCSDDYGSLAGAISGCLKLVQSQPTIVPPSNEPLTLEELRGMNGEPVWLRGSGLNRWYIFDGFSLDGIPFFTPEIGYGKPWAAYRRRPEKGTTE